MVPEDRPARHPTALIGNGWHRLVALGGAGVGGVWFTDGVLYLVRHGRTSANASGLLQGRLDPPLDDQVLFADEGAADGHARDLGDPGVGDLDRERLGPQAQAAAALAVALGHVAAGCVEDWVATALLRAVADG